MTLKLYKKKYCIGCGNRYLTYDISPTMSLCQKCGNIEYSMIKTKAEIRDMPHTHALQPPCTIYELKSIKLLTHKVKTSLEVAPLVYFKDWIVCKQEDRFIYLPIAAKEKLVKL